MHVVLGCLNQAVSGTVVNYILTLSLKEYEACVKIILNH